jgi:esterase/lipase superfamily enzyme
MATQMKSYSCKYCDISGLDRKSFIKHTKEKTHKIRMKNLVNGQIYKFKMNEVLMSSGKFKGTHKTVKFHTATKECDKLIGKK